MRHSVRIILWLVLSALSALAQNTGNSGVKYPASTPNGQPCSGNAVIQVYGGNIFSCQGSTYAVLPSSGGGSGTVLSFSSGNLSPLFTTFVGNPATTPALSFTLSTQTANEVFASPDGASGSPLFRKLVTADFPTSGVTAGTYGDATHVGQFSVDATGRITSASAVAISAGGPGTVTSFSAGNLSPLFTTSVATATSTPALSFSLTSAAANLVFASPNGTSGVGGYRSLVLPDLPTGYLYSNLSGAPTLYNQTVENSGTPVTQRAKLNFVGGTNVTITPTDNGTDTTTLTIAATTGGGGVSSFNTRTGAVTPQSGDYSAFYQATGNYLTALTGDGTASGPGSATLTLATVNSSPGACGDATHVCEVTTNGKGLVTGQSAVVITGTGVTSFNSRTGAVTPQSGDYSAFYQATGNYLTGLTGDITASGPGSAAATLATVNSSPGSCGDATHVCQVTTNGKGLVTAQSAVAITGGGGVSFTGTPTATAIVTAASSSTIQTPSATATLDSSGNLSTPGSITGASIASSGTTPGAVSIKAGTGNIATLPTNSYGFAGPVTGGTSYLFKLPATITAGIWTSAAPATGDGVNESAVTMTPTTGSGNVVLSTSPSLATPNLGTPSAVNLSNATSLPCGALPALTGDATTSAGSCATTVGKVNGGTIPVSATLVGTNSSGQFITNSTAYLTANQTITLTGDTTGSGSTAITTTTSKVNGGAIPASAVVLSSNSSNQVVASSIANNTVLGNVSGSTGAAAALTATQMTTLCNAFTASLSGCVPASGGGTTTFLRADGTFATPPGGGMVYPGAGIAVSTGSAWGTSLTAPSGAIVGTTDTQTLTNKTVDGVTPTTFGYLDPTSSVQTQLNAKAPTVSPTFTAPSDSTSLALTSDHLTLSSSSSPSFDVVNTAAGGHHFQWLYGLGTVSLYDQTGVDTPFYIYNAGSIPIVATNANGQFGWSSNTQYADQGTIDTYLTRLAAGSIGINGTAILTDPGSNGIVQRTAAGVTSAVSTTGSGNVVLATSPTLTTPTIGVATATSINKVAMTAPATSATLTIANGKTLTANNSITLAGTDSTTMTFPSTSATITQTIASGTATLGTSAIASGACATVVTATATGAATTDAMSAGFNGDPTAATGYGVSATGAVLTIYPYLTANTVNFKVCNSTAASITPGALTLNWRVTR